MAHSQRALRQMRKKLSTAGASWHHDELVSLREMRAGISGDKTLTIGIDEVGQGALAGPLVICAAVIDVNAPKVEGVTDSKKIAEKRRFELAEELMGSVVKAYFVEIPAHQVDIRSIELSKGMVFRRLATGFGTLGEVWIDGRPTRDTDANFMVKGDLHRYDIGAASILAKVYRDSYMYIMSQVWPYYKWETNKGYGTAAHYDGLAKHQRTPIHRKKFL